MSFLLRWIVELVPTIFRSLVLRHALDLQLQVLVQVALQAVHIVTECLLSGALCLFQLDLLLHLFLLLLLHLLLDLLDL